MTPAAREKRAGTPQEEFFAAVHDAFEGAKRAGGGAHVRRLRLAGVELQLEFGGDTLLGPMTRAFAHAGAPSPGRPADTTVLLWDAASSGVRLPPAPWSLADYGPGSKIASFSDELIYTCYQGDTGSLLLYHAGRDLAVYCTLDAATLPTYETAAPLRTILHWSLRRRGLQLTHAGAVGRRTGAVLLAGNSGAGKSSTALACLASDLLYLSDDYCAVDASARPTVHSLFSTGKVEAGALRRMPFLEPLVANRERLPDEKVVFFLHQQLPHKLLAEAPIRALALPRVTGGRDTSTSRASPFAALVALAPSTHGQLPYAGEEVLGNLAQLVRRVPAFHLDLGYDVAQVAPALEDVLARAGG